MLRTHKIATLIGVSLAFIAHVSAQNYTDVLRYSQKFYQGTARTAGTGNAFGAIGADFGALSINPAGLGLFRRPEFTAGFSFNQGSGTANYLGAQTYDDKYNFNINNMGLVLADVRTKNGEPVQQGWVSINYAVGFSRTNNFHLRTAAEGTNYKHSILENWAEEANRSKFLPNDLNSFSYSYLGYNTGLLQHDDSLNEYWALTDVEDNEKHGLYQGDYYATSGAMNDINFSIAGNYSNKIYVGANISVPTIGYNSERIFTETNLAENDIKYYNSMQLTENLSTAGIGITAGFGAIYRVSNSFRTGASLQLPTFFSLTDEYSYAVTSDIKNKGVFSSESPEGSFDYSIVTPMRATISATYLFGKTALLSADYEFVDYTAGRINTNYDGVRFQNDRIRSTYKATGNLRVGGEYRYDNLAFRAGFENHGSPFKSDLVPAGYNGSTQVYAGGIGIREQNYYLDVTYQRTENKYFQLPYTLTTSEVEGENISTSRNNFMFTIGSRF